MRRLSLPHPVDPSELLGILLAGVWGQTRPECAADARAERDSQPGGAQCATALPTSGERS